MDRVLRSSVLLLGIAVASTTAWAQSAPGTVTNLIVANLGQPQAICNTVAPVIQSSPGAFAELVNAAQTYPDLLEPLGECCAAIQTALSDTDPAGAQEVSDILVASPAPFQAACAISLAEGGGTVVIAASAGGTGTAGVGFGGIGGGSGIGSGGGVVSPSRP